MAPADFSNQWLEFWRGAVFLKELAHVPEVLRRKPAHTGEGYAQVGGKLMQLGSRLIESVSKKLADEFFANFAKAVSEG